MLNLYYIIYYIIKTIFLHFFKKKKKNSICTRLWLHQVDDLSVECLEQKKLNCISLILKAIQRLL